jgi:hypothetical protein
MKPDSAFIKTALVILLAAAVITIVSLFVSNAAVKGVIEGMDGVVSGTDRAG